MPPADDGESLLLASKEGGDGKNVDGLEMDVSCGNLRKVLPGMGGKLMALRHGALSS